MEELELEFEEASPQQPPPPKITKTRSRLHTRLEEIEHEITKFIDMPSTSLETHAQHVDKKLTFINTLLNAEIKSEGTKPNYDLSEIKEKLTQLKARLELYLSDLHPDENIVHGKSESGSDCELCLNSDDDDEDSVGSDIPEKLYEEPQPPEVLYESTMMMMPSCSDVEKVETAGGGGKRPWWRTVAPVLSAAALMVSFCSYLVSNRDEDFLTPT